MQEKMGRTSDAKDEDMDLSIRQQQQKNSMATGGYDNTNRARLKEADKFRIDDEANDVVDNDDDDGEHDDNITYMTPTTTTMKANEL
jgi:hypothetical protein